MLLVRSLSLLIRSLLITILLKTHNVPNMRENFQTLVVRYVMFNFKFLSLTPIMILDVKNLGQAAQGMLL